MSKDRRSTELTDGQWLVIDEMARDLDCVSRSGPSTGQPSWRVLIARLANRESSVIALCPEQLTRLDAIAKTVDSTLSWRQFIAMIADGKIILD